MATMTSFPASKLRPVSTNRKIIAFEIRVRYSDEAVAGTWTWTSFMHVHIDSKLKFRPTSDFLIQMDGKHTSTLMRENSETTSITCVAFADGVKV